jgi:hypothetical protein
LQGGAESRTTAADDYCIKRSLGDHDGTRQLRFHMSAAGDDSRTVAPTASQQALLPARIAPTITASKVRFGII